MSFDDRDWSDNCEWATPDGPCPNEAWGEIEINLIANDSVVDHVRGRSCLTHMQENVDWLNGKGRTEEFDLAEHDDGSFSLPATATDRPRLWSEIVRSN